MALFTVTATVTTSSPEGECSRQVPAFIVDTSIRGNGDTADEAGAEAARILGAVSGVPARISTCAVPYEPEPVKVFAVTWEVATGSLDGETGSVEGIRSTRESAHRLAVATALDFASASGRYAPEQILVNGRPEAVPYVAPADDDWSEWADDWEVWIEIEEQRVEEL